jgi:hypothetical protein
MSTRKLNKRESVAEWYAMNVFNNIEWAETESAVEWLVMNLSRKAFNELKEIYDEQMSNLEAEGFFK